MLHCFLLVLQKAMFRHKRKFGKLATQNPLSNLQTIKFVSRQVTVSKLCDSVVFYNIC